MSFWLQVDNFGTVNLVEACRKLGVNRFILISSILVNGAAMGQILNPAYIFLNAFGLILIAKLQAEQYIRKSGINYTIIRPGGLRNDPPTGNIVMEPEVVAFIWDLFEFCFCILSNNKRSVVFMVSLCVGYSLWRHHIQRSCCRGCCWGISPSWSFLQSCGDRFSHWCS